MVTVWPTLKPCLATVVMVQVVPDSVAPLVAAMVATMPRVTDPLIPAASPVTVLVKVKVVVDGTLVITHVPL